ncbi:MAG: EthD family reductase [Vulcanimicrobiaceae bacterium]
MAAHLIALYGQPTDKAAFDAHYVPKHVPLAKKIPGLRSYAISNGPVTGPDGSPAPYYLVADLRFDSRSALQTALGSPEAAAAVADVATFASGGITLLTYEDRVV